jgi:hypothetical protein
VEGGDIDQIEKEKTKSGRGRPRIEMNPASKMSEEIWFGEE